MIRWIVGASRSGKSRWAEAQQRAYPSDRIIILDGWACRKIWGDDLGKDAWDATARWAHNFRLGEMAKILERQGFEIIVTSVCPYPKLRDSLKSKFGAEFVYMSDPNEEDKPYKQPGGNDG